MDPQDDLVRADAAATRNRTAVQVLRRLDELGAIKLDVLLSRSAEISQVITEAGGGGSGGGGVARLEEWERICYPFVIRVGPRSELDLVSVAAELKQLGFDVRSNRG